MDAIFDFFSGADPMYTKVYLGILRYAAPVLVLLLLWRCLRPLVAARREPEIWAWLELSDGTQFPLVALGERDRTA